MKKFISLFALMLVAMLTLAACSKTEARTTIDSEEEWNNMFNYSSYSNVTMKCDYSGTMVYISFFDDERMHTNYESSYEDEVKYDNYTWVEGDSIHFMSFQDDIQVDYYDVPTEFIDWEYEKASTFYIPYSEMLIGVYEDAVYDESEKCYNVLNEEYGINAKITAKDGRLYSLLLTEDSSDGYVRVDFSKYNVTSVEIPEYWTVNNRVADREEWESLFNPANFTNITVKYVDSLNPYAPVKTNICKCEWDKFEYDYMENDYEYSTSYYYYDGNNIRELFYTEYGDYWDSYPVKTDATFEEFKYAMTELYRFEDVYDYLIFNDEMGCYELVDDEGYITRFFVEDGNFTYIERVLVDAEPGEEYTNSLVYEFTDRWYTEVELPRLG